MTERQNGVEQGGHSAHAGARNAAEKRLRDAKRAFTEATANVLARKPGAAEQVDVALAEVNAARDELRALPASKRQGY